MLLDPNLFMLYVNDASVSAHFYKDLLNQEPIYMSPGYAMFALKSGFRLGLWACKDVEPATMMTGGGSELAFQVEDNNTLDEIHARWKQQGLAILQSPTTMDFGYTFLALDPDNHRLRVFSRSEIPG